MDIVTANRGSDNVGVLLGQGNGTFANVMIYSTGSQSTPWWVALGDVNNDNRMDIISANTGSNSIGVLLGTGNGTFVIGAMYSTGGRSRPYTVTIADFNNDNRSDLAIANSGTNNVLLLYGFNNGTFGNEVSYSLGYDYRPYSITVTDVNQDGWMDIIIACYDTDNVDILIKMCL
jgi:hypothetical protein